MDLFLKGAILGIVQGLTEFLPISSTGHLIIAQKILKIKSNDAGLVFDTLLHTATLFALFYYFRKDFIKMIFCWRTNEPSKKDKEYQTLGVKIIIATIPAAFFAFIFEEKITYYFRSIFVVALTLFSFSFVLFFAEIYGRKKNGLRKLNLSHAFVTGLFQSIALIPGVSRSGITISGMLFLGYKRYDAAKFTFLLSFPIILLAVLKQTVDLIFGQVIISMPLLLSGFLMTAVSSYLSIAYFLEFVKKQNFIPFVIYRILLSLTLLVYF